MRMTDRFCASWMWMGPAICLVCHFAVVLSFLGKRSLDLPMAFLRSFFNDVNDLARRLVLTRTILDFVYKNQ